MRCLLIGALAWASVSAASAGEPAPPATSPEQAVEAAEHLRSAAQHLEEAGLVEQAARLRDQAADLLADANDALLERKLAEWEALRAEIADLRRLTGRERQVLLRVAVLEVEPERLAERGVDWQSWAGANAQTAGRLTTNVLDAHQAEALYEHIGWLRQNELVRVLAEPMLVTLSERPAYFNIGGEFAIPAPQADGGVSIEFKKFGTQVDFVPMELGGGALRVQFRARISALDHSRDLSLGGMIVPGLTVREVDTAAELERGQVLVIGGLTENRVVTEEIAQDDHADPFTAPVEPLLVERKSTVELIVIVRPELIPAAPQAPQRAARRLLPPEAVDHPLVLPVR